MANSTIEIKLSAEDRELMEKLAEQIEQLNRWFTSEPTTVMTTSVEHVEERDG